MEIKVVNKTNLDYDDIVSSLRWPHIQIRGKRITKEQALDIICKTEMLVTSFLYYKYRDCQYDCYDYLTNEDIHNISINVAKEIKALTDKGLLMNKYGLGLEHLDNNLYRSGYKAWISENGIIAYNGCGGSEWVCASEIVEDLTILAKNFPYLDMMIIVTNTKAQMLGLDIDFLENPIDITNTGDVVKHFSKEPENLYDYIEYGFRLENGVITIMQGEDASIAYKDYIKHETDEELLVANRPVLAEHLDMYDYLYSMDCLKNVCNKLNFNKGIFNDYVYNNLRYYFKNYFDVVHSRRQRWDHEFYSNKISKATYVGETDLTDDNPKGILLLEVHNFNDNSRKCFEAILDGSNLYDIDAPLVPTQVESVEESINRYKESCSNIGYFIEMCEDIEWKYKEV